MKENCRSHDQIWQPGEFFPPLQSVFFFSLSDEGVWHCTAQFRTNEPCYSLFLPCPFYYGRFMTMAFRSRHLSAKRSSTIAFILAVNSIIIMVAMDGHDVSVLKLETSSLILCF